ncbi:MAG: hypothetical protein ACTSX1_00655 [Candidatus Heimdallarchaeaceae archaeon]
MESYEICLECYNKVMQYRHLMKLYKAKKLESKPVRYSLCVTCAGQIDMENYFHPHRYRIEDGHNAGSYTNCIVPCGYGMFAPKFYYDQVIKKRRGI